MRAEIKICLPFYKIVYSFLFIAILSVIRGIAFSFEIGIALEDSMALLTAVFCADTYVQEIVSKRSEIERLYPMKNRIISVFRRMAIQEIYLFILAIAGYGMFYIIQRPYSFYEENEVLKSEPGLFLMYIAAIIVTLLFWGIFSHTVSCLFRNMWAGIGGSLILWVITNSTMGDKVFGNWNLFSYSFRYINFDDTENCMDLHFLWGKLLCIILCIIMTVMFPKIIKKRG